MLLLKKKGIQNLMKISLPIIGRFIKSRKCEFVCYPENISRPPFVKCAQL